MNRRDFFSQFKMYQHYLIVGVISLFAIFFIPFLGSEIGLGLNFPNTKAGWIVYVTKNIIMAVVNILIFHCFVKQGEVNVQENEKYKEANAILEKNEVIERAPLSPKQFFKREYGVKGTTIFLTSVLSAVGLTQAILTFDWVSMLTYLFVVVFGIIYGLLEMNNCEEYWTQEYYDYAKSIEKNNNQEELTDDHD